MSVSELCFFCGGHQDLLTLYPMGGTYTGNPAVTHCPLCLSMIEPNQAAIFECTDRDPQCSNPLVKEGVWYTGRWTTVPKSFLARIYNPQTAAQVAEAGAGILHSHNYRSHQLDVYTKGILQ